MPLDETGPTSPVEALEEKLSANWPAIRKARETTRRELLQLEAAFDGKRAPDTSLVLFGSIARQEMTGGSDTDWILLVDGEVLPEHEKQREEIEKELERLKLVQPGKSGVFGCAVGSYDLVHKIGGEDDLNSNTTRRVLLLLESVAVGRRVAYDRVLCEVLRRYLVDDYGLCSKHAHCKVPRFLLNDSTRYWRTVTVDFVYKQRSQEGKKWAVRNAKLRMSRKLLFAAALLRCFFCELDDEAQEAREALRTPPHMVDKMLGYLQRQQQQTPLETLAHAALLPGVTDGTARRIFTHYDRFLSVLDDEKKRKELEELPLNKRDQSAVWPEIRKLSEGFQCGLTRLLFDENAELAKLTRDYGIF